MEVRLDQARHDRAAAGVDRAARPAGSGGAPAAGPGVGDAAVVDDERRVGNGGAPVPSMSWPLVMTVVPVAVFMAKRGRAEVDDNEICWDEES